MIAVGLFDNEERYVLNSVCEGTPLAGRSKERVLGNLTFAREVSAEQDVLDLLDGLIVKFERISDDEWEILKQYIPFGIACEADEVEFPQDEAV